jgi:molecular chaperone IbpA
MAFSFLDPLQTLDGAGDRYKGQAGDGPLAGRRAPSQLAARGRWISGPSGRCEAERRTAFRPQPCLFKKDVVMRTVDFSPLYRSVVGFDRLAALLDAAASAEPSGYPPYNIETVDQNAYRVEIAVAGFKPEELHLEVRENVLTVQGRKAANDEPRRFLHRGLAERNFERRFQLADYVVVTDAQLADGLLSIHLKRELPESLKPRRIEINTVPAAPAITDGAQAA